MIEPMGGEVSMCVGSRGLEQKADNADNADKADATEQIQPVKRYMVERVTTVVNESDSAIVARMRPLHYEGIKKPIGVIDIF